MMAPRKQVLCFALVTAVAIGTAGSSLADPTTIVPSGGYLTWEAGRGYEVSTGRFADQCVSGDIQWLGGKRSRVWAEYSATFADLLESKESDAGGGVNLGIVGADQKVEFFSRIAASERRESLVAGIEVQWHSAFLDRARLSSQGSAAAAQGEYERRRRCGNQYIFQIDYGYRVYAALVFHFRTQEAHEHYRKTVTKSALFGAIKSRKTEVSELNQFRDDLWLGIDVLQDGGDRRRLQELASIGLCSAAKPGDCIVRFGLILDYLSASRGANGFLDSIADGVPGAANGPAVLRYLTADYESAGVDALPTSLGSGEIEAAVARMRQELSTLVVVSSDARGRIDFALQQLKLTPEERRIYELKRQDAQANIDLLNLVLKGCESSYAAETCLVRGDQAKRDLKPIDDPQ